MVLTSERGLAVAERAARVVQDRHGHLTLIYLVDRMPMLAWHAGDGVAAEFAGYAEKWGSDLLHRVAARLPRDISVSTHLVFDSNESKKNKSKNKADTALADGRYELVIVENHAALSRRCQRRLKRAFGESDARLITA